MHILLQLIGSAAATLVFYLLTGLIRSRLFSQLSRLPGPKSSDWVFGHLKERRASEEPLLFEKWMQEYGRTYKFKSFFGQDRLFTLDSKALNHVIMHHFIYQRPEQGRWHLSRILGNGVLVTEGDKHKLQRKVMNPAFGPSQIRDITEIFVDKAVELREVWLSQVDAAGGTARINVLQWISRMTLDVIGRAGFNYEFNSLKQTGESNELANAFSVVFGNPEVQATRFGFWTMLQSRFPVLRFLPMKEIPGFGKARETMNRIAKELLRDSKEALRASGEKASSMESKDLLTLLVKSNMSGEPSQRMSDEDVLAQVPTFLTAGFETTSTATTWALFGLVQRPDVQQKLREELYALQTDTPTMDQLNSLPYLDAVVRETLRFHAPVPLVVRVAAQDDVIPLEHPVTDKNGVTHSSISVQKGQEVAISILAMNRDKELWGEDATEFKPERWQNGIPEAASAIPGVWGNMMTFLGGARACIGYRFALVEMKALLFILLKTFTFELAVPIEDITKRSAIVQRPRLKSEPHASSQLPLLVRAYRKD
ncbi:hypothetical protein GYMLUDRAFT_233155 [Collybiopsis luxurians FD-317 M1]|uniref:Cytochrome P450 n=1 Tax=Collybiopsis luxurians FD-317 M1 TaxID=944289 RepID=A0A0D0AR45_9AGAR|nr:hypothetical protein GYMLUDRAFT_233155 [Collybiopsis luxurians FD-317 M1]